MEQMARVGVAEAPVNAASSSGKKQRGRPRTRQVLEDRGDPSVPAPYNLRAHALPGGAGIQVSWSLPDTAEYPSLTPTGFNIIGQTNKKAIWSLKVKLVKEEACYVVSALVCPLKSQKRAEVCFNLENGRIPIEMSKRGRCQVERKSCRLGQRMPIAGRKIIHAAQQS